jgi:hypothetical protein
MPTKFCQCCGMPLRDTDEMFGPEKILEQRKGYCIYCYRFKPDILLACLERYPYITRGMTP